ncbi:Ldh family oxidoreductase [Thermoflavifilum thermophilum]|uniref:Malate/lactate/ureidoglycolate dehydrogenase, LDH2 family n=1 Tax=Thermoflavifilum thermophilum TaxID=1393122 RepID=A0A1I7NJ15_9BACT|nr:Ldh family oxidoreductase [Thermoflavifilum thermophilum]SFV34662.1 Malate/lactate/ureidoglycolate dehydrogenase, LDH2 family [Thermoflavifilum thermophilum]
MEAVFSVDALRGFTEAVFQQMGFVAADAALAADVLLKADLRGIDSHGLARLPGYVRLWDAGRIRVDARPHIVHETPSTALVDGDAGLGLLVAPYAMRVAIAKASQVGAGWVAVRNSNHFGIAGYHAMLALEKDMIGIALTNASPLVAPALSLERMLGTNPIAVAIPAGEEPPVVIDMATAAAANGKLEILQRKGGKAPLGWVQDAEGRPTHDPFALQRGGALLPLGSRPETGSHKGYCLSALVDILSGVLPGAGFGPWVPPFVHFLPLPQDAPPGTAGIGHFFGAMRIDAFRPAASFKTHMDSWIRRFRSARPIDAAEPVKIPGDPERAMEAERLQRGIPLHQSVIEALKNLSARMGVPFPDSLQNGEEKNVT